MLELSEHQNQSVKLMAYVWIAPGDLEQVL